MAGRRKELARGPGGRPQMREAGGKRFGPTEKAAFLSHLVSTCNVTASARAAGVCTDTVYRHRRSNAAFRAGWAEAVRDAYGRLELMMLERMMNGTVKTVTKPDGSVEKIHEYPNALALQLLRLHRDGVAESEAAEAQAPEDVEELRERVFRKIQKLRERLRLESGDVSSGGA